MKTNVKLYAIVSTVLLIIASGCGNNDSTEKEEYVEKITNVEFFTVKPVQFIENISLPVVVLPYKEVNLGLTNGGRVTKILVDKGDRAKEGQLLLETDDIVLKAAYDMAKSTLEWQKSEFARIEKLYNDKVITEADYDAAKHALAQAESSCEIAEKNYEEATLEAPFSGIVTSRNVENGDLLAPGTPAFRIIDISSVKVQAGIPEKYIVDFKKGNKVRITIDAIPDREFEGTINYIAPEASREVRTFLAEIIVNNADGSIRAGVMGNARIVRKVNENALMIPINALIETQNGMIVYVLKEGDIVEERRISTMNGNDLMIQTKGLSAGEKIITKGNYDLIDGEKVNVTGEYIYAGEGEEIL